MNTIIITGASRGIGAAIARKWCELEKENLYYSISRSNDYDITNYNSIQTFFKNLKINETDYSDALINNAGIIKLGNTLELSIDDWIEQFNVNVHGLYNCCREYIYNCRKNNKKGKIINIASTAGLGARAGRSAYSATKAAVINYSLSLSEEMKEYGIKVYCVCPGAVNTDMRHYINPDDDFENMMAVDEVADFVCKLIIDGKNLDGQILKVTK